MLQIWINWELITLSVTLAVHKPMGDITETTSMSYTVNEVLHHMYDDASRYMFQGTGQPAAGEPQVGEEGERDDDAR